ncbi:hypothetical protein CSUI_006766 [Cystoisospora suis]|uniref:Uncharacterized protein n=1 Tax=Cystoisospora suis TaxID=483139 RepID=A0A2C6KFZ2_9APIC|nr:hypothetical protein CSUI_006766 [Cystoisospora suis]
MEREARRRDHERRSARAKGDRVSRSLSRTPRSHRRSPPYNRRHMSSRRGRSRSESRRRYSPQSYQHSGRSQRRSPDVYRPRCSASRRSRSRSPRTRKQEVLIEKERVDDTCTKPRILPATATIGSRLSFRRTTAQITPVVRSASSEHERTTPARREESRRSCENREGGDHIDEAKQRHRDGDKCRRDQERKKDSERRHVSRSRELTAVRDSSLGNGESNRTAGVGRRDRETGTTARLGSGEASADEADRPRQTRAAGGGSGSSPSATARKGRQSYNATENCPPSDFTPRRRGRECELSRGDNMHTATGPAIGKGQVGPPGSLSSPGKSGRTSGELNQTAGAQPSQSPNPSEDKDDARSSSPRGRNRNIARSAALGSPAVDGPVTDSNSLGALTPADTNSAANGPENPVPAIPKASSNITAAPKRAGVNVPDPECLIQEQSGPIHPAVDCVDIRSLDPSLVAQLPISRDRRVWYPDRLKHHRGLPHSRQVGLTGMPFTRNADSYRFERAGPTRRVRPLLAVADTFASTVPLGFERQTGQLTYDLQDPAVLQKNRKVFLRESPFGPRHTPVGISRTQDAQYSRHEVWQEPFPVLGHRRRGFANERSRGRKTENKWTHDLFEQVASEPEKNRRRFNLYAETLETVE